jgi:hypothetical protein
MLFCKTPILAPSPTTSTADGRQLHPGTHSPTTRGRLQIRGQSRYLVVPITGVRFPVDHKIKSRHTANAVLKQADLPKEF